MGATPDRGEGRRTGRRPAIDVVRVVALAIVVAGHLALAVIDRRDGALRGANLLSLRPRWAWVAVASPMPMFFAAAGWANATATVARVAPRLRSLAGVGAAVVGAWSCAVVAARVTVGGGSVVEDGARLATQPLWFLAAYAPLAACGGALAAAVARRPLAIIAGCVAIAALLDVGRFALGWPTWTGWVAFGPAWGTAWLAGAWWRSRSARWRHRGELAVGGALAAGGALGTLALVRAFGYSPALIDVVPGARSNTSPPTVCIAVVGLAQVGVLVLCAGALDRLGVRWAARWRAAGEAAVGVYAWHLTALALCAAVVAAGAVPMPTRLTLVWWLTRPLWWAAVLGVAALLVAASARWSAHGIGRRHDVPSARRVASGVVLLAVGAAYVGLRGPTTPWRALVMSCLFLLAWWALRGRGRVGDGAPSPTVS